MSFIIERDGRSISVESLSTCGSEIVLYANGIDLRSVGGVPADKLEQAISDGLLGELDNFVSGVHNLPASSVVGSPSEVYITRLVLDGEFGRDETPKNYSQSEITSAKKHNTFRLSGTFIIFILIVLCCVLFQPWNWQ